MTFRSLARIITELVKTILRGVGIARVGEQDGNHQYGHELQCL